MKSYLQQLENNEAILLMYLADELAPQDRAEVEQMLASDARLRAELENLQLTHQLAFDTLESLDSITRPPLSPAAAQKQLSPILHQWLQRRKPLANGANSRYRLDWLRSSAAVAASLMIGSYIWLVYHTSQRGLPSTTNLPPRELTQDEKISALYSSFHEDDESNSSEDSNLHVAEVAAAVPLSDSLDAGDVSAGSDANKMGAP